MRKVVLAVALVAADASLHAGLADDLFALSDLPGAQQQFTEAIRLNATNGYARAAGFSPRPDGRHERRKCDLDEAIRLNLRNSVPYDEWVFGCIQRATMTARRTKSEGP